MYTTGNYSGLVEGKFSVLLRQLKKQNEAAGGDLNAYMLAKLNARLAASKDRVAPDKF